MSLTSLYNVISFKLKTSKNVKEMKQSLNKNISVKEDSKKGGGIRCQKFKLSFNRNATDIVGAFEHLYIIFFFSLDNK
jgi:hypothetical protein